MFRKSTLCTVPVVLEDLKAIDVQQTNDREMFIGVILFKETIQSSY